MEPVGLARNQSDARELPAAPRRRAIEARGAEHGQFWVNPDNIRLPRPVPNVAADNPMRAMGEQIAAARERNAQRQLAARHEQAAAAQRRDTAHAELAAPRANQPHGTRDPLLAIRENVAQRQRQREAEAPAQIGLAQPPAREPAAPGEILQRQPAVARRAVENAGLMNVFARGGGTVDIPNHTMLLEKLLRVTIKGIARVRSPLTNGTTTSEIFPSRPI